jgi:hypothetical protein
MIQYFSVFPTIALAGLLATCSPLPADTIPQSGTTPDFKEIYGLLRTNLAGATDAELNCAAVEGLLAQLPGKAFIVGGVAESPTNMALSKAMILADDVAYLRVARVGGQKHSIRRRAFPSGHWGEGIGMISPTAVQNSLAQ